jgi:hypothetical protein
MMKFAVLKLPTLMSKQRRFSSFHLQLGLTLLAADLMQWEIATGLSCLHSPQLISLSTFKDLLPTLKEKRGKEIIFKNKK